MDFEFDRQKFRTLVQYIAWKVGSHPGFGATKLNKALWFSDSRVFVLTGKPITGATYIRLEHGPVPREFLPIRDELQHEGLIRVFPAKIKYDTTRVTSDYKPSLSVFSKIEIEAIEYWVNCVDRDHTAKSVSDLSHDYGWEIAEMGEKLPYFSVMASRIEDLQGDDLNFARRRLKALGLG